MLASKKSILTWDGIGTRVYPKDSPRAIYQRLKREARDPDRYMQLKLMVTMSDIGKAAGKAGKALRQTVARVETTLHSMGPFKGANTGRIPCDRPNMSNVPKSR